MKYLLFLILFLSLRASAQQPQNLGGTATVITAKGQILVDSALRLPSDTIASAPAGSRAQKSGVTYRKTTTGWQKEQSEIDLLDYVSQITADCTTGANTALAAAITNTRDLHIPRGTYNLNTVAGGGDINFPANTGSSKSIRIYGDKGGTVLTTSSKTGALLQTVNNSYSNIIIENIDFVSTHDTTTIGSNAILLQGTNPNFVTHVIIRNCRFSGFSIPIVLKGCRDVMIEHNVFQFPKGHDCATTTTVPAVCILLKDDSLGNLNKDIKIIDNWAEGTTGGLTGSRTRMPMDGFIYGHADGFKYNDNILTGFGQEAILTQPQLNYIDSSTGEIKRNTILCYLPKGTVNFDSSKRRGNTAIRVDNERCVVDNNTIRGATTGILQILTSAWNYINRGLIITNNTIYVATDTGMYAQYGILVQGYSSGSRSKGAIIADNHIFIDSVSLNQTFYGITANFYDSGSIRGNEVIKTRSINVNGGVKGISLTSSDGFKLSNTIKADTTLVTSSVSYESASTEAGTPVMISDANYTVLSGDESVIYNTTLTANRTLTFPGAVNFPRRHIKVYLKTPGGFQLNVTSGSNIYFTSSTSATTQAITTTGTYDFESDGNSWLLIGH